MRDRSVTDGKPAAFPTIVFGGLAVGVLDALAAMANAAIRGVTPDRVWQYVASSVIGSESFNRGATTVALGLFFHFCVAFGVSTAFYLFARLFPVVIRYAVITGVVFGVAVYFAMAYAIVPLTAARQAPFSWYGLISGLVIHILFVGLPVTQIARRYAI